jgi:hypothetical protein
MGPGAEKTKAPSVNAPLPEGTLSELLVAPDPLQFTYSFNPDWDFSNPSISELQEMLSWNYTQLEHEMKKRVKRVGVDMSGGFGGPWTYSLKGCILDPLNDDPQLQGSLELGYLQQFQDSHLEFGYRLSKTGSSGFEHRFSAGFTLKFTECACCSFPIP